MGEQFGAIPLVLSGMFPSKDKPINWLTRTLIGTTFIYEIKIYPSSAFDVPVYKKAFEKIYGFGYGSDDCQVFNYWNQPPFSTLPASVRSILLKRGDRLLIMATDFGEGGECTMHIDPSVFPPGKVRAVDGETGAPVTLEGQTLRFALSKHDFKLIEIEPVR
jgi:hypothetical protein